jgi:uncharacterized membrane protein
MDPNIRILIQWLHVLAGVLWIGGGAYSLFVQLPAVLALPPQARGPATAQLAPRQIAYILRMAEVTIATGVLQIFATGRADQLTDAFGSRWAGAITLGIVGALAIYVLVHAVVKPTTVRLLGIGARVAAGEAAAAEAMPALVARLRTVARVQVAIGFTVIFLMVVARFS